MPSRRERVERFMAQSRRVRHERRQVETKLERQVNDRVMAIQAEVAADRATLRSELLAEARTLRTAGRSTSG